ncbi:MAG: hypothetical protein OEW67_03320 [Cyclobacteriaceae bacterium]|nr:hypothetical protein [Cyclobacteriaceae bacterium]
MKMMPLKGLVLTAGIFLIALGANAQCKDWIWPEDRSTAEEKNVLYSDAVKAKQYRDAVKPWQWLVTNTPNLNSSIYINGTKIYNELAKVEKDPVRKKELVDSLLWVYDKRIEVCGQKEKHYPTKVFYDYIFNIKNNKDTVNVVHLYDEFEAVFDMSGQKVNQALAQAYVNVLKVYQLRMKKLTDEEILEKYDWLISVIDYNVAKETDQKKIDKWESIRANADQMLIQLIKNITDCEFIKEVFVPKFEAEPTNLKYAQWIFKFMLMGKCTSEPIWMKAAEVIYEDDKQPKLAEILGNKYLSDKDYANAEKFYNEGLELSKDDKEQNAEFYVRLGHVKRANGSNSAARDLYRKAVATNPSNVEPYSYIGVLYTNSYEQCRENVNKAQDRLIYIAAYNMYKRAGDTKRMAAAKEQFPSVEEIFEVNWDKGQTKQVGCWINEPVILSTRD